MPDRATPEYSERLYVPWGLWVILLAVTGILALELAPVLPWPIWITVAALLGLTTIGLLAWSLARVRVTGGQVLAPGVSLPCDRIASVEELDARNTRAVLGPAADPAAVLMSRPWLRTAVRLIPVDDDPPYVLLGTRNPEALADAVVRCAEASGRSPS